MKPDSSPSPDENSPNEGAGSHGQKGPQDLREQDLWDFTDDADSPAPTSPAPDSPEESAPETLAENPPQAVTLTPRGLRKEEFPFRAKQPPKPNRKGQKDESRAEDEDEIPTNFISKTPSPPPRKVEDAFDDLDASDDDTPAVKPSSKAPVEKKAPEPAATVAHQGAAETMAAESLENPDEPASAPLPAPVSPRISLSKVEKIALISVLALLAIGSIFFITNSVYKIPEKHVWLDEGDFPIKGKKLQAIKAKTYWRTPAAGEGRIGSALLPVIDLELHGGPAAIRVFFKNAEGESAGDAFTKNVNGTTTLNIVGTAGFEDLGMHAAYRTTDTDRWIVEIYEGPSVSAPIESFKKLFELPISTDRR